MHTILQVRSPPLVEDLDQHLSCALAPTQTNNRLVLSYQGALHIDPQASLQVDPKLRNVEATRFSGPRKRGLHLGEERVVVRAPQVGDIIVSCLPLLLSEEVDIRPLMPAG